MTEAKGSVETVPPRRGVSPLPRGAASLVVLCPISVSERFALPAKQILLSLGVLFDVAVARASFGKYGA